METAALAYIVTALGSTLVRSVPKKTVVKTLFVGKRDSRKCALLAQKHALDMVDVELLYEACATGCLDYRKYLICDDLAKLLEKNSEPDGGRKNKNKSKARE